MLCRNHIDVSEGIRRCARCGAPFCKDCLVDISGKPYCATCKTEQILDVRSGVERGVLDLASIGRRFGAVVLDWVLLWIVFGTIIVLYSVTTSFAKFNSMSGTWNLVLSFAVLTYQAAMLAARGQTLGKMALHLKVVNADGSQLSRGQAWGREITRALLGILCILEYIPAFFTKEKTTLHDLAAKTRVVNWA